MENLKISIKSIVFALSANYPNKTATTMRPLIVSLDTTIALAS